jgi:hypothetical protein
MLEHPQPQGVEKYLGKAVFSTDGERLGVLDRFIPNRLTSVPEWMVLEAGLFGSKRFIVPLAGSEFEDHQVRLGYPALTVTGEPAVEAGEELTPEAEALLEAHFGLGAA